MKPKILISGTGACENYVAAVEAAGGLPVVACCPQFSLDYDGLLLTGGGDIAPDLFGQELDGSTDIDRDRDMAELEAAVDLALQHDSRVVFERFVQGQEVECAVRGNDEVSGTHPGEILASAEFYTYDDKYISGTSRVAIPAQLAPEKLDEVRDLAVHAYRALCCKGLARVDFFVEHGTQRVLLNEINTLPGFTSISMYPKLMLAAGETYPGLLDSLITLALERAGGIHD